MCRVARVPYLRPRCTPVPPPNTVISMPSSSYVRASCGRSPNPVARRPCFCLCVCLRSSCVRVLGRSPTMRREGARSASVRRWAVCADGSGAFGMDGCRRCGGLDGRRGRRVSGASRGRGGRTMLGGRADAQTLLVVGGICR